MSPHGLAPRRSRAERRTVGGRLLASFVVVLTAFALTLVWCFFALRAAARDAALLRAAYVPLLTTIGEALAGQNVMNTQLNHITSARNPDDVRQWLETAGRVRPLTFQRIDAVVASGLSGADSEPLRADILAETAELERSVRDEAGRYQRLFRALAAGDKVAAEKERDELLAQGTSVARRLRALRQRVDDEMTALTNDARKREGQSIQFLIGLGILTLVVGLVTSIYARRVLGPLAAVTERARAVAAGDLSAQPAMATDDEIGELSETFESMVAAIRRARAELVRTERLATIGKMAARITHEVRNPLSSIGLNLELLEEEIAGGQVDPHEARQLVLAIREEVDRLSKTAEQYLSAARQPQLELAPESLPDLVRECHAFLRRELDRAGVESRVELDEALPPVWLDEGQIRQALSNLLRNAREALVDGGEVVVSVSRHDADTVALVVDDDGPGVPGDAAQAIFDPFHTTKQGGTGLGLAICRAIVEAHGGAITVQGRPGGGTRFRITLPIAGPPPR